MDGYAQAGGTDLDPNTNQGHMFYSAENPNSLTQALNSIANEVASCEITIDNAPIFVDSTLVEIGGQTYNQIDEANCNSQTGWYFSDVDNQAITLCGAACDAFKDDHNSTVVQFYCMPG